MNRPSPILSAILLTLAAAVSLPASAGELPLDTGFTYQGRLSQSGALVDGSYDMEFRLFLLALGGTAIGAPISLSSVPVADGLFTVELSFPLTAYGNNQRWLEISLRPAGAGSLTTLTPRQELTPTPFALFATAPWVPAGGDAIAYQLGNVGIGVANPISSLHVVSAGTGVRVETTGPISSAVLGDNNATTGANYGGRFTTESSAGTGVYGRARSDVGSTIGVYGICDSPTGIGVSGFNNQLTGTGVGIHGEALSPDGWAGYFFGRGYFDGNVGIGTTLPLAPLHVEGGSDADPGVDSGGFLVLGSVSATNLVMDSNEIMARDDGGTSTLFLQHNGGDLLIGVNGNPLFDRVGIGAGSPEFNLHVVGTAGKSGGGSWSVPSDARLKKDVHNLDGSLDALLALRGVSFQYIDPTAINETAGSHIGMIAQEVEQLFPQWVSTGERGYKSVSFSGFEALTVEALRDLRTEKDAEIDDLKSHISNLQSQNHSLQSQLDALRRQLEALTAIVGKGAAS